MLPVFIIIIGLILIVYLGADKENTNNESGELIKSKYSELIANINANSPDPQTFISTSEAFSYGWITPNADNRIYLKQRVHYLEIKWVFKARLIWENRRINLSKKWYFPDNGNPVEMANKISAEMSQALNGAGL